MQGGIRGNEYAYYASESIVEDGCVMRHSNFWDDSDVVRG